MRKIVPVVLASVLAFASATPALAVPAHHGAGRCFDPASLCHAAMNEGFMPHVRSLHAQVLALVERASAANAAASARTPSASAVEAPSTQVAPAPQSTQAPSYGYGGCGYYVDADADGICDYHGSGCYGRGYGDNSYGGNGYGRHHGGGHHGGWHH